MTNAQAKELCRLAGIAPELRDQFAKAVERCVASYLRVRSKKSPNVVEEELKQLEKRIRRCLRLLDYKTWRPGTFQKSLEAVSLALHALSQPAREFLQNRNAHVVHTIPEGWSPTMPSMVLINPICFSCIRDQAGALTDLVGALAGPLAKERGRGRPRRRAERALYHCLAFAFTLNAGKTASDSPTTFLAVCDEIKSIYEIEDWRPASLSRSARLQRARKE